VTRAEAGASATLRVAVTLFAFDADPGTPLNRALHLLRSGGGVPAGELLPKERFGEGAQRLVAGAGVGLSGKRSQHGEQLTLIGLQDAPARNRSVTAWYLGSTALQEVSGPGEWIPAGRHTKAGADEADWIKLAQRRLRSEARFLAGAAALLGEVFTADDLLRLHVSLHGGPEGSERTFRRRIQELRDTGVLRSIRVSEVAAVRDRVLRFRSPAGTGGRPPELLRYSGSGGETEELAGLRTRRLG